MTNLGLEPVWKTAKIVLVSTVGHRLAMRSDPGVIRRLFRYTSIIGNQAAAVRKRWLIAALATGRHEGRLLGRRDKQNVTVCQAVIHLTS